MGRIIIDDVAARAGVSIKTVSRVMNKEPAVSPATLERVRAAVRELGYRPNRSARGLAGGRSYLIALLYDNPSPGYLAAVQAGVLDACQDDGYAMVAQPVAWEGPELLAEVAEFLRLSRADGLVLTPPVCDRGDLMAMLRADHVPHVAIAPPANGDGLEVTIDDRRAAREMTEYLLSLGHRRIAFIKGHPAHGAGRRRFDGYLDALRQAGLRADPALAVQGRFSFDSGQSCAAELLALDPRPTAIFAANDDMAAGVVSHAQERGLRIPGDVAVAGFDDSRLARQIWPPLTTVRQPVGDMGRGAAELLLANLGERPAGAHRLELPHAIVIRRSTETRGGT